MYTVYMYIIHRRQQTPAYWRKVKVDYIVFDDNFYFCMFWKQRKFPMWDQLSASEEYHGHWSECKENWVLIKIKSQ